MASRAAAPSPPGSSNGRRDHRAVRERGDAALSELTLHLDGVAERPDTHRVDPRRPGARALRRRPGADRRHSSLPRPTSGRGGRSRAGRPTGLDRARAGADGRARRAPRRARRACTRPAVEPPIPSSVLMGCVPARVAGVGRLALATPPEPDGPSAPSRSPPQRSPGRRRSTRSAAPRRWRRSRWAPSRSTR